MTLGHRQRGDKDLKDLRKVYLCAAQQDQQACLDMLYDDLITAHEGISLWFPERSDAALEGEALEAHLADLSQMGLFVVPVTMAFLATPNRAREVELPLALERHIPVLPILMEPGLEERFNRACGSLQCLSRVELDPTALPYPDKLRAFLETVLLRDETVQKVRDAFAAYVFLSYRKKDRAHAQEVMRLIHARPLCRDVAIWYDEFLTPGEDFNESIRQAFAKSGLFSLVVTPSLLEDPNYVMSVEFPLAMQEGAPILPVETVPTDPAELARLYPGIPACVPADELAPKEIERLVTSALDVRPNDDPEHVYLMGLAYLGGIDVERDGERALGLVAQAAGHGVVPALATLSSMFETGNGVERDYTAAAEWQERYALALEERLGEMPSSDDLCAYLEACANAGRLWKGTNHVEEAHTIIDRGLSHEPGDASSKVTIWLMNLCITGYDAAMIGMGALGTTGDRVRALGYAMRLLELCERLLDPGLEWKRWLFVSMAYDMLGRESEQGGHLNDAAEFYETSIAHLARCKPPRAEQAWEARQVLVTLLQHAANAHMKIVDAAAEVDEEHLRLARRRSLECMELAEECRKAGIPAETGFVRSVLSDICEREGKVDQARILLDEEEQEKQEAYERRGSIRAIQNLAQSLISQYFFYLDQGDLDAASDRLLRTFDLYLELAGRTSHGYVLPLLTDVYERLSDMLRKRGRTKDLEMVTSAFEDAARRAAS